MKIPKAEASEEISEMIETSMTEVTKEISEMTETSIIETAEEISEMIETSMIEVTEEISEVTKTLMIDTPEEISEMMVMAVTETILKEGLQNSEMENRKSGDSRDSRAVTMLAAIRCCPVQEILKICPKIPDSAMRRVKQRPDRG